MMPTTERGLLRWLRDAEASHALVIRDSWPIWARTAVELRVRKIRDELAKVRGMRS